MVALPFYEPVRQLPYGKKDIDIFFSGTLTTYRNKMTSQLINRGFSVFNAGGVLPEFLREDMLGRSKLAIGLKLDESTHILSKCRAHYYLTRLCPHLFERVADETDLDPFLSFSNSSDIVEEVSKLLNTECHFDSRKYEAFKSALPYELTFSALNNFFKNSPMRL